MWDSNRFRRDKPHCFIHEIIEEKAESAKGKAAAVQIISLVPHMCTRKDGRNYKSQHEGKQDSQKHPGKSQAGSAEDKMVPLCIAEEKLADKGTKSSGEHTDMQVFFIVQPFITEIEKRRQKTGPHVEKIESVKAV